MGQITEAARSLLARIVELECKVEKLENEITHVNKEIDKLEDIGIELHKFWGGAGYRTAYICEMLRRNKQDADICREKYDELWGTVYLDGRDAQDVE